MMETTSAVQPYQAAPVQRSRIRELQERRKTLVFYVGLICVLVNSLLEMTGQAFVLPAYARPSLALGFVCVLYLFNDKEVINKLRKKAYVNIYFFWFIFFALATYSSFVTKNMVPVYNPVSKNLLFQLFVFESLSIAVFSVVTGRVMRMLDFVLIVMGGMLAVNDLLMFGGIRFWNTMYEAFIVGTKFDCIYFHMNFVALLITRLKLSRRDTGKHVPISTPILVIIAIVIVMVSIRVDCNTGMMGALLFVLLIYLCDHFPQSFAKTISSPKFFAGALLLSVLFASYVSWFLNIPMIAHFIVDKMGRSLTLTGRTKIYAMYPGVMSNHWGWGWGLGNSYPVCWTQMHFADTQNALLEWILQIGVIGTFSMCMFFYGIMMFYQRKKSYTNSAPLLCLVYVYILLGTVEISMNNNFWLFMILLFLVACDDQKVTEEVKLKMHFTSRTTRRGKRLLE